MWAHDFLQADPEVKTLKTHLKANNTLCKWWFKEYYLKENQRLGSMMRFFRFFIVCCIYLIVVIHITSYRDWQHGSDCNRRLDCKIGCILDTFPALKCVLKPNFEITYAGNEYKHLYDFHMSDPDFSQRQFNACRKTIPPEQLTLDLEDELNFRQRLPRTQTCFAPCRKLVPNSFYGDQYLQSRYFGATWDTQTNLGQLNTASSTTAPTNSSLSSGSGDSTVVDTSIPGDSRPLCNATTENDETKHLICVDDHADKCERTIYKSEVCLGCDGCSTDSDIEQGASASSDSHHCQAECWCFSWELIVVSICWISPLLFLYDSLIIFTVCIKSGDISDVKNNASKCGMQWLLSLLAFGLFLYTISVIIKMQSNGRPEMVWLTFFATFLVDQVRQIVCQALIWYILLRRFGRAPLLNESEAYRDEIQDDQLTPIQLLQKLATRCVEARRFDLGVYAILGLYAIFLLALIALDDHLDDKQKKIFTDIDTFFLALFAVEIMIRVLAIGVMYFMDLWNLFDFAIVVGSWIFAIQGYANPEEATSSTTLALLRLLRLLRLVNGLRKLSASKKKSGAAVSGGLQFSSPVERVLEVFREVKESKGISSTIREEISWSIDIISSNKLYSISVDAEKTKSGEGFLEQEVNDWVRYASDSTSSSFNAWKDNELEKFLLGQTKRKVHEENILAARTRLKEVADLILQTHGSDMIDDAEILAAFKPPDSPDLEPGTAEYLTYRRNRARDFYLTYLEENLQAWNFDLFKVERWAGRQTLLVMVVSHCFVYHELSALFEMSLDPILDYIRVIEEGYTNETPYHTSAHAADVVQALHCMLLWHLNGKNSGAIASQDVFAALIAAAIHDYEHPGVNNSFLVRTRHPIALRYNDFSVLENHHVSAAFHAMMAQPVDPLCTLSEAQYQQVRRLIISMVLATDAANHFSELSLFKTKINAYVNQGTVFPERANHINQNEDKKIFLNILLHSADMSNAARVNGVYIRSVQKIMEEYFRQGDLEREKNLPVSMFFDRNSTSTPKCQQGFIDVLVLPLFSVLGQFIPEVGSICCENLNQNRAFVLAQAKSVDLNAANRNNNQNNRNMKDDNENDTSFKKKRATMNFGAAAISHFKNFNWNSSNKQGGGSQNQSKSGTNSGGAGGGNNDAIDSGGGGSSPNSGGAGKTSMGNSLKGKIGGVFKNFSTGGGNDHSGGTGKK